MMTTVVGCARAVKIARFSDEINFLFRLEKPGLRDIRIIYIQSEIAYFSRVRAAVRQIIRFHEHGPRYSYSRRSFLLRKYIKRHINHKSLLFKGARSGSEKAAVCFSSFFPGPFVNFIRKIATLKFQSL